MNILINKETFQSAITQASRFTISKFTTTTHLQGVLIKAENKLLHIISTDLNLYFHKTLKIKETGSLRVVVEPKTLIEYLSFLESGDIEVEIKNNRLVITKNKDKGTFPIIEAADFPQLPKIEKEKGQKINASFLTKNLPMVLFSASTDESRPALTGIKILIQDNEFNIVSTDGFRLSLVRGEKESNIYEMLIPGRFLDEVLKETKAKELTSVEQFYSEEEKTVMFRVGDCDFYSRLIEGEYPDYEKVVPSESKTKVVFEREELLQKIRRVSVFAREYSNIIICEVKKDGVYFSPKTNGDTGSSAFQEAEIIGDEQKIAFNFKFVFDFLTNAKSKKISVEILRPDAPVVFKEVGKKDFLHIIMPIRIGGE